MLQFYVTCVLLVGLAGGVFLFWRRRIDAELKEGAILEWRHLQETEPEFVSHLDEAAFTEIFHRVNDARFPGYALAAIATYLLSLPLIFVGLIAILWVANATGATPEPVEVARQLNFEGGDIKILGKNIDEETRYQAALYYVNDLSGFYYFFGVLVSWLFVVAFYGRRYHARRPGYLRDEIIRARP